MACDVASIQAALGGAPKELIFDGKPHRFPIDSSRDAGWYIARLSDGLPLLNCGDWRTGEKLLLIGEDRSERTSSDDLDRQRRDRQQRATRANRTASLATRLFNAAPRADDHPYLERKGIPAGNLRLLTPTLISAQQDWFQAWSATHDLAGALLVPMYRDKRIVDLQIINASGKKLFLPHGDHVGAFTVLGKPSPDQTLIIATGYATAATLRACTASPVICTFSDGNLEPVVAAFRAHYLDSQIVIAADNDIHADPKIFNSGVRYSTGAARKHHCLLAVPHLDGLKVDYNDLYLAQGKQAVVDSIARAKPVVSPLTPIISAAVASAQLQAELSDWLNLGGDIAIKGAAGLGKSTMLLQMVVDKSLRCDYFVPSYALAKEQAERLPEGTAIAIRGRTHQTSDQPPLCHKHEAATALQKAGLASQTMPLLCGKFDQITGERPCPYFSRCGYMKQFQGGEPIRFYAHEYLPLSSENALTGRKIDIAVVDESFQDALEKKRRWSLGELFAQPESVYHELATAITENRLLEMTGSLPEIDRLLQIEEIEIHVHPEMEANIAARACKPLIEVKRPPVDFLRNCKAALDENRPQRLWFVNVENGAIFASYRKPIRFLAAETPKAFLDASLSESVIKAVSPECRIVDIQASRLAHITQITDSAMSYRRLMDDKDYLSSRLMEFIHRQFAVNPNGAVIAPMRWIEKHKDRFPVGLKFGHFGALRGLNTLERCDWLIQIGRFQPPPYAVESAARAWFPDTTLNLTGGYLMKQVELTAKNGDGALVMVHTHADPRCQELLESVREQESLQALDRLRLIHSGKPKQIWLLSNLPLPGIEPDQLATLDKLTLPGRLAEVALRDGVIVTGRNDLAVRHPDLFPTADQAREAVRCFEENERLNGWFANNIYIGLPPIYPTATYRVVGQPGKPRTAIIPNGQIDAVETLTNLHSKPIRLVEPPPQKVIHSLDLAPAKSYPHPVDKSAPVEIPPTGSPVPVPEPPPVPPPLDPVPDDFAIKPIKVIPRLRCEWSDGYHGRWLMRCNKPDLDDLGCRACGVDHPPSPFLTEADIARVMAQRAAIAGGAA